MKYIQRLGSISLLALMLLSFMANELSAQNNSLPKPNGLYWFEKAVNIGSGDDLNSVSLSWGIEILNNSNGPIKYNVYLSDSCFNHNNQFQKIAEIVPDSIIQKGNYRQCLFNSLSIGRYGCFELFLTAVYPNGESHPSNTIVVQLYNPIEITFTSIGNMNGKKNELYTYTMTVESSRPTGENIVVEPIEMPTSATFNAQTKTVSWTPTESGTYSFYFKATGSISGAEGYHYWFVYVPYCDVPAKVSGTVKDKKGNSIDEGIVYLLVSSGPSDSVYIKPSMYYETAIVDGEYLFDNVDAGKYAIAVSGADYSNGMENQFEFISIACADEITKNLTIQKYNEKMKVIIKSMPIEMAKVDEVYQYQIIAEVIGGDDDEEYTVNYELLYAPSNASIDPATGLLTWTPTRSGEFDFQISASVNGEYYYQDFQYWRVNVVSCDVPGILSVNVKYDDNTVVEYAMAHLFSGKYNEHDNDSVFLYEPMYYQGFVENGQVNFPTIDKGDYYLVVHVKDNFSFRTEFWYNGAYSIENATVIPVECGDTISLTMIIDKPAPLEMKTISGTVTRELTGEPVPYALVELIPMNFIGAPHHLYMHTTTDNNGNYLIVAPNNATYVARASSLRVNIPGTTLPALIPEFYDGVGNIMEATELVLNNDLTNINFSLKDRPVFVNSIAGTIKDDTDFPIEGAHVIAYRLGSDANTPEDNWYGHNVLTNQLGAYQINNITPGNYIVFAIGDKRIDSYPGYYKQGETSTWNWEQATRLVVTETSNLTGIDIQLGKNRKLVGNGKIIGFVGENNGAGVISGGNTNNALNGANVYAAREDGEIFTGTLSVSTGEFSITDLPVGKYTVMADKVGYKGVVVDIEIKSLNDIVTTYVPLAPADVFSSIEDSKTSSAMLYPNPAKEQISIAFSATHGNADIMIFNAIGHSVATLSTMTITGLNSVAVSLPNLTNGQYYAKISNNGNLTVVPFVILK